MEIAVEMKIGSIGSWKVRILGVLLFATLLTGCYESGWGGESPGYTEIRATTEVRIRSWYRRATFPVLDRKQVPPSPPVGLART